jgi:hypothetical protein
LLSKRKHAIIPVGNLKVKVRIREKPVVLQATLALMVLKTLDLLVPQHGYGTTAIIAGFFSVKAQDLG